MPRSKLSDEQKRKKGTLQKCRSEKSDKLQMTVVRTQETPAVIIEPPTWLRGDAKKVWRMVMTTCSPGHLQLTDAMLLERWCSVYNEWKILARRVEGGNFFTPEGYLSSEYKAYIALGKLLLQCEKELGFTPISRSHVKLPEVKEEVSEYDDF